MTAVTIRGLISTTRLRAGDEVTVEYTDSIADLERAGFIRVLAEPEVMHVSPEQLDQIRHVSLDKNPESSAEHQTAPAKKSVPRKRAPRKPKTDG